MREIQDMLRERGIDMTQEQREKLEREVSGTSMYYSCYFVKQWMGLSDTVSELIQENEQKTQTYYPQCLRYIHGFVDFHDHVSSYELMTALATNSHRDKLQQFDRKLGLRKFFGDHMYCVDDVQGVSKPQPNIYQYTANQLGITPQESIVIEDSYPGIWAARKAGAYSIGLVTGNNRNNVLHADYIAEGYGQIDLQKVLY